MRAGDRDRHDARRTLGQIVVDECAVRRILAERRFGGRGFGLIVAFARAIGGLRREQTQTRRGVAREFAQRFDIVEDPEGAAMRGDREIASVNADVAHGDDRHVETQRLPSVTVVERDEDAGFRGRV